jgi:hypothetical protein
MGVRARRAAAAKPGHTPNSAAVVRKTVQTSSEVKKAINRRTEVSEVEKRSVQAA